MSASEAQEELIPLYDGPGGVSCDYFNISGRVSWRHRKGDWSDANGVAQGPTPLATATIESIDRSRAIEWDITAMVRTWMHEPGKNTGVLLAGIPGRGRGDVYFHSREADDPSTRPRLVLEFADGASVTLPPDADAHLDCSTVQGLGRDKLLHGSADTNVVLHFRLEQKRRPEDLRRAALQLTTIAKQYGNTTLGAYVLDAPRKAAPGAPELGIAKDYPWDRGIEKHRDVLMATGFESPLWFTEWSEVRPEPTFWPVGSDSLGFEPLSGKALKVKIPRGGTNGLNISYDFKSKTGSEPEEIYFRYYLRFANDWMPTLDGGKLPGISGTYNRAGWGGRKWDGKGGWSMRGGFARAPEEGNPMRDYVTISTYAYHAGAESFWGDEWVWDIGLRGLLQRNRWYCIEQYFRINRVGTSDGEIKGWVDGELAFHRTGIRVRDIPDIRIEKIWMNVYHGGTTPAAADLHLYIDNVVIARHYIGPLRRQ